MIGLTINSDDPVDLLFLGAHCDDIEIGCGGTLLKLIRNYSVRSVNWVVFSSNEIRKTEALRSAGEFLSGVPEKHISVLDYKDGFLPTNEYDIKSYFEQLKATCKPSIIFTHYRDDRHQDHRLISNLTWNTYRNHLILEYEIPKYDGDLGVPNFFVELDDGTIAEKNRIILESFKSQAEKHWFDHETFNAILRLRGMESAVKFAEGFYARKISF